MNERFAIVLGGLAVVAFLSFIIAWNVSIWSECRETNSFAYCLRLMSK